MGYEDELYINMKLSGHAELYIKMNLISIELMKYKWVKI